MYRYETHLHTYPVSQCAGVDAVKSLEIYKEMGYDGVFVTNHFLDGNINLEVRELPYEEQIEFYFSDYEKAKAASEEILVNVVEVQGVQQGVSGLVASGSGDPVSAVDGQGESLTEVVVGHDNTVDVGALSVHLLQGIQVGSEEQTHGVGLVDLVHLLGGAVGDCVLSGDNPIVQLASQEGQLGSVVGHDVDNDLLSLELGLILAVDLEADGLGGGVQVAVVVSDVLEVGGVLDVNQLLSVFQRLDHVSAVGHGGVLAGAVGGGDQAGDLVNGLAGLVQFLVDDPVGGAGGQEVVVVVSGLADITDGVVVNLV